ncbi:MAG TPA: YkvA family protein [Polyangiaceae bacterium]|nr:YkvA family protein [Polyangiaceae bacterium]
MTTPDSRYLEAFPGWLRSLAEDAQKLAGLLEQGDASPAAQRGAASALNYLFKSLDLIPDGLEDLGFIDDAFVLRVAAALVGEGERDAGGVLGKLAADATLISEFLGADYARLERYVQKLGDGSVRGRSVAQILEDSALRSDFVREVLQWSAGYTSPSFARDARSLVKLKSFLGTRLPQ